MDSVAGGRADVLLNADAVPVPNAAGVDVAVPNADCDCPNAVVAGVVLPNADGVVPNEDGIFDAPALLDPSVNAEAGIAPNGDDPNEVGGLA